VGTGLGALLTVAGVVVTKRSAGRLRVMADPAARRRYGIIVGLEFGVLGAGAAILGAIGQYRWTPVWICFGVGVHFFPLASILGNQSLRLLGGRRRGGPDGRTRGCDRPIDDHRRRSWVVPARLRPGYPADPGPGHL